MIWGNHRDEVPRRSGDPVSIQYARKLKLHIVSSANATCSWFTSGQGMTDQPRCSASNSVAISDASSVILAASLGMLNPARKRAPGSISRIVAG